MCNNGGANSVAVSEHALLLMLSVSRRLITQHTNVTAGRHACFDRLVVVTCRPEQRVARWAKRMKVDEECARAEVSRRMGAQLPDEKKIEVADYVIDNSGSLDETRRQVNALFPQLRAEAAVMKP